MNNSFHINVVVTMAIMYFIYILVWQCRECVRLRRKYKLELLRHKETKLLMKLQETRQQISNEIEKRYLEAISR